MNQILASLLLPITVANVWNTAVSKSFSVTFKRFLLHPIFDTEMVPTVLPSRLGIDRTLSMQCWSPFPPQSRTYTLAGLTFRSCRLTMESPTNEPAFALILLWIFYWRACVPSHCFCSASSVSSFDKKMKGCTKSNYMSESNEAWLKSGSRSCFTFSISNYWYCIPCFNLMASYATFHGSEGD